MANAAPITLLGGIGDKVIPFLSNQDIKSLLAVPGSEGLRWPMLEELRRTVVIEASSGPGKQDMLISIMEARADAEIGRRKTRLVINGWSKEAQIPGEPFVGPDMRRRVYRRDPSDDVRIRHMLEIRTVPEAHFPVILYSLPNLEELKINKTPYNIERMLTSLRRVRRDMENERGANAFCGKLRLVEINVNPPAGPQRRQPDPIELLQSLIGKNSVKNVSISHWFDDGTPMSFIPPKLAHIVTLELTGMRFSAAVATAFLRNLRDLKCFAWQDQAANPSVNSRLVYASGRDIVAAIAINCANSLQYLQVTASADGNVVHEQLRDLTVFSRLREVVADPRYLIDRTGTQFTRPSSALTKLRFANDVANPMVFPGGQAVLQYCTRMAFHDIYRWPNLNLIHIPANLLIGVTIGVQEQAQADCAEFFVDIVIE